MSRISRTLLIVDDSPEDRELYRRYLLRDQDYAYTILEAELGQAGLDLWQQHQPDAVLLDYRLPDLDGLEFLQRLQPSTQEFCLPIILMTGQGNEAIAVQAIKAGAQDYLIKGQMTPERLQLAVSGAIAAVQPRSQLQQRIEHERVISQIIQKIQQTLKLEEILQTTVTEVRQFLQTDRVLFFRLEIDGNGTVVAESVGAEWRSLLSSTIYDPCLAENYLRFCRPDSLTHDLTSDEAYVKHYRQGQITAIADIKTSDIDPCHVELLAQFQVRANLVVPILHGDRFWGLLIAHHCGAPRSWQAPEIDLLKQLAPPVSIALRQAELYQQAQQELQERNQAEAALRTSEARFRTLADNMSQFAWMADKTGWIFWYNQRWFDYTGTTLESMQGWGWQSVHHPDHLDRVVQYISHCFATGELWEDTFPLRGRDDQYRWFLSRAIPIRDESHQIVCWFGTNTDIDDRKQIEQALRQSEERYRCLAELIPQLVWTTDAEGKLLDVNQRWTDFTGVTLKQAHTNSWEQVVHPDDAPLLAQQWAVAVRDGTAYQAEGRMRRVDGVYRWHLHQAIPQTDQQGQTVRWFGTATDIEAQKLVDVQRDRLLAQEQAARAEADRANRMKDEFLAVLSHELRSPLNPILGWAKLLQTRKLDAAQTAEALNTIERNAKLQTQLIDDLLDVAKILRGKLSMSIAPIDLSGVIESAIDTVRTAATAKSIVLHAVLPQIGRVSGDATRLQQVIWNLLSNAVKFTPNHGRVEIWLERMGNQAQITVSDTGKGINPNFLPHIFESFHQEDASTTRKYGGLGLGLAIVRSLVEAHGGTIFADSLGEGQGSIFTVRLPLLDAELEPQSPKTTLAPAPDLTGMRVLAVDDEPDARDLLTILLTHYGADVLTVTSAAEALAAVESFQPDALVSDIGMPDVDGYNLIQQIRALPAEKGGRIPAIALTAYARESDQQQALSSGYQRQVTKPLDPEQLVQALLTLTQQQSLA